MERPTKALQPQLYLTSFGSFFGFDFARSATYYSDVLKEEHVQVPNSERIRLVPFSAHRSFWASTLFRGGRRQSFERPGAL